LEKKLVEAELIEQAKKNAVNSIAERIYNAFCDHCSFDDDSLDWAFYAAVEEFGAFDSGGTMDTLMKATIRHVVEGILSGGYDEAIDEWVKAIQSGL
jgi:hypothetical protein